MVDRIQPKVDETATPSTSSPNPESETAFRQYFHDLVDAVLDPLVSKAREYGTTELEQLGGVFRTTQGFDSSTAQANLQVATWFYAQGKAARWTAAVRRGEAPSNDTVLDLMVYCMMHLKITETGEWWTEMPEEPAKDFDTAAGRFLGQSPLGPPTQADEDRARALVFGDRDSEEEAWSSKEYLSRRQPRVVEPETGLQEDSDGR